jgi:hypothetical protein
VSRNTLRRDGGAEQIVSNRITVRYRLFPLEISIVRYKLHDAFRDAGFYTFGEM